MIQKESFENQDDFDKIKGSIKRGDIVGAEGKIGRSQTGELTVVS